MEYIRIDTTDIFIDDQGEGRGKIIVADTQWDYNFSYFWGAMGKPMPQFLIGTSACYFAGKLCGRFDRNRLDFEASMKAVRRAIREEFKFWEYMPWQKELREYLRGQHCETDEEMYHLLTNLDNQVWCELDYEEEKEVMERLMSLFEEPHAYIEHKSSRAVEWLEALHKKLVKTLKSQVAAI